MDTVDRLRASERLPWKALVVRSHENHGEEAVAQIDGARFIRADLSVLAEVRALGARLAAEGPLRLLVNNVGGMWPNRWITADGTQRRVGVERLAAVQVTHLNGLAPGVEDVPPHLPVADRAEPGQTLQARVDRLEPEVPRGVATGVSGLTGGHHRAVRVVCSARPEL